MRFLHSLGAVCLVATWSCGGSQSGISYSYDFSQGQQGWVGAASEFAPAVSTEVNFAAGMQPSPLAPHQMTLHLYGNNVSDDLFLFAKKQLSGLAANHSYLVDVKATLVSHTGQIGGSSQIIKLGASTIEPRSVLGMNTAGPYFLMNVDIGGSSTSGKNAVISGNLSGTGTTNPESLTFTTPTPLRIQSDANGSLWLLVGVDSAFEVGTEVYYTGINATLR